MSLQTVYTPTIQDFEGAQNQHWGWKGRILQIFGVLLMLSALSALSTPDYLQAFIGFLLGGFLTFGRSILVRRTFKKEPSLQLETNVVVSDDGLIITNSRGEGKLNWSAFIRYTEAKEVFVLYVQSRIFYIIPKRAFRAEEVVMLREMFNRHISRPAGSPIRSGLKALLFGFVIIAAIVLVYVAVHASRA